MFRNIFVSLFVFFGLTKLAQATDRPPSFQLTTEQTPNENSGNGHGGGGIEHPRR